MICFAVEWDFLLFNCPDPKNLSALPEEVEKKAPVVMIEKKNLKANMFAVVCHGFMAVIVV